MKNKKIKPILNKVLEHRGIEDKKFFLDPSLDYLSDFGEIKGAKKTAAELKKVIKNNKKVIIFGHDDVDGISSTIILYEFLKQTGIEDVSYYIPNRNIHKFGLDKNFLQKVIAEEYEVVITVDIGIAEKNAVKYLLENHIKTIIIDHHNITAELPQAAAICDPKLAGDDCKLNILAGVGVVYHVLRGVNKKLLRDFDIILCGLGTLADRVELLRDNRVFSRYVYENLFNTDNTFIDFFIENNKELTTQALIKKLIIILTIARSKKGEHRGLKLLLESDIKNVMKIYKELEREYNQNELKKDRVKSIISKEYKNSPDNNIFFYFDNNREIPVPFLGLAASFVADNYKKPCMILSYLDVDTINGECRGPGNFDWVENLAKLKDLLVNYGGHKRAAGFTAKPENVEKIKQRIKKIAKEYEPVEAKKVTADYSFDNFAEYLKIKEAVSEKLAPFGKKNPLPVYEINQVKSEKLRNHLCSDTNLNIDKEIKAIISFNNQKNCTNLIKFEHK
ncbi:MAG: DHH family phosphoesterase [Candidatus Cloacimonetes bacterium]|nr:DHH family phosphoesterase [Candidatus Cloacimonadota bacterium]